jgi:hypothetical protein
VYFYCTSGFILLKKNGHKTHHDPIWHHQASSWIKAGQSLHGSQLAQSNSKSSSKTNSQIPHFSHCVKYKSLKKKRTLQQPSYFASCIFENMMHAWVGETTERTMPHEPAGKRRFGKRATLAIYDERDSRNSWWLFLQKKIDNLLKAYFIPN